MLARLARSLARALAAAAAVLVLCDCSTIRHVFHTGNNTNKQAEQLQILQLRTQRFADEYVGSIVAPIRRFQESTDNSDGSARCPELDVVPGHRRLYHRQWSKPLRQRGRPRGAGDLEPHGDRRCLGRRAFWRTRRRRCATRTTAWNQARWNCQGRLPPDQIAALQQVIIEWRAQNPHVTAIAYVHFRDVAGSIGRPANGGSNSLSAVFSPCWASIPSAAWTPRCARLRSRGSLRSAPSIMRSGCRTCWTCRWSG